MTIGRDYTLSHFGIWRAEPLWDAGLFEGGDASTEQDPAWHTLAMCFCMQQQSGVVGEGTSGLFRPLLPQTTAVSCWALLAL